MKTFKSKLSFFFLYCLFLSLQLLAYNGEGGRAFEKIEHAIVRGDITYIGNTVLCPKNADGTCIDDINLNNHIENLRYITNSSADLTIPLANHEIVWAGLFWMGVAQEANNETTAKNNFSTTAAKAIRVTTPDNIVHSVPWVTGSSKLDTYVKHNGTWFLTYQAYTNITSIVVNGGIGTYKINDLYTTTGSTSNPDGNFGAWMIAVIYKDQNQYSTVPLRDVSVFNGFKAILDNTPTYITVNGFYTPKNGDVNANMTIFTAEGDYIFNGDTLNIKPFHGPNSSTYHKIIYPGGNENNAFVSGISLPSGYPGTLPRSPSLIANYAIDLHTIEIGDSTTNSNTSQRLIGNKETGIDIKIDTNNDSFYASTVAMSTEIYEPDFCYDYAYKQQGIYFTENNDGTHLPRLTGNVLINEPVELTVFIRNLVDSDIEVTDMNVSILDINTSQTTYIRNTTKVAEIGDLIPQSVPDSSLTVSDSFIKNIYIGTIQANEHFYVYYDLNPLISDLNDSMKIQANFNLTFNGEKVPYNFLLGQNMKICSTSNFKYAPAKGIFNIVHNDYYTWDGSNGNKYYNLPTQVTERTGNFKVISMDPDNLDDLKPTSTIVAVDMIDASAFHDTNASCMELASSISPRVWVTLENNTTYTPFNNTIVNANFYNTAKQNAAFRVSYNITNDGNGSLVEISGSNPYTIDNYDKLIGTLTSCPNSGMGTITTNCGNDGDSLTKAQLTSCMECLYGGNTKLVCSRDNFSIRPEAFMLNLDDQNQSSPTSKSRLTTNYSGAVGATAPVIDLAADYNYNLEINASNYLNNISSNGYTRSFNKLAYPNDPAEYKWEPRTGVTAGACNDEDNKSIDLRFVNGKLETNTSVPQVGEYRLHLLDTTWTAVDSDPTFMTHHNNSYFLQGLDCQQNSSATQTINSLSLNGCNISSSHLNPNNSYQYNDLNVTFHPYTFAINNTLKIGPSDILPPATLPFVYMANISTDENMSVHLHTTISAVGANSPTPLSNFVTGCYAKLLDISIDKSPTKDTNLSYEYRFHDFNATTGGSILTAYDVNASIAAGNVNDDANLTTLAGTFRKSLNGTINTQTNLNFKRAKNVAVNPEEITFISYKVHNSDTFNADLVTNKMADGNASLNNQKIIYYYGRTNAPRVTITCKNAPCQTRNDPNLANNPDHTRVYVYDEVYCYQTTNGNVCDMNLLPAGTTNSSDKRWWINLNEDQNTTAGTNGIIGSVKEISANNVTELNQPMIYKYKYETVLKYNGNGNPAFPYFANMENNASDWLIYDESNAAATGNKFRVDFIREAGWNGVHETNTTTNTHGAVKTNRRIMW